MGDLTPEMTHSHEYIKLFFLSLVLYIQWVHMVCFAFIDLAHLAHLIAAHRCVHALGALSHACVDS